MLDTGKLELLRGTEGGRPGRRGRHPARQRRRTEKSQAVLGSGHHDAGSAGSRRPRGQAQRDAGHRREERRRKSSKASSRSSGAPPTRARPSASRCRWRRASSRGCWRCRKRWKARSPGASGAVARPSATWTCWSPAPSRMPIMDAFVGMDEVARVLGHGETKSSVELHSGMQVDLRILPPERWGTALQYFTGSQAHNIHIREIALAQGLSLNEHSLYAGQQAVTTCSARPKKRSTSRSGWRGFRRKSARIGAKSRRRKRASCPT